LVLKTVTRMCMGSSFSKRKSSPHLILEIEMERIDLVVADSILKGASSISAAAVIRR
jgi:hypothetical protein